MLRYEESRLSSNPDEVRERILYVRLPHTIRNVQEVEKLCIGDFKVKLRRQSSRACHVIFSTIEEKIKNMKILSEKVINGKRVIAHSLQPKIIEKETKRPKQKKVVVPEIKVVVPKIKAEKKFRSLHISNIKPGTRQDEIMQVLQGCLSVTFLKRSDNECRAAIVRMEDPLIAAEYVKRRREWPNINGNVIKIRPDTRQKRRKKKSESILKIYD